MMDVAELDCEMDTRVGSQVLLCQTPSLSFPCHDFRQKTFRNYRNRYRRRLDAFYEDRRVAFGLKLECLWDIIVHPWWRMRKWGRHRLAFLLVIFMLIVPYGEAGESPLSYKRSSRKVCSTINVMNDIASFSVLKDCEVIEGNLQIVLVATNNCSKVCEEEINNITFPKLREVTGYVVFWRVKAIRSLGSLFPNLSVIRGRELFINYALVAYEMTSLEDIGLYSLTHILRGSVRFDVNLRLCFMKTINWDMIAKHGANRHYFGSARPEHECPKCPEVSLENELCPLSDAGTPLCWNKKHCQKDTRTCDKSSTGECCHESCLGGCDGKSSKDCYACRGVMLNSDCVEKCPQNTYKYVDRRCVTADECIRIRKPYNWELLDVMKPYPFRPVQDVCSMECPANFLEEEVLIPNTELKQYRCVPCKGRCKKECPGTKVDSIASIQKLYGCTHIVGSLEIELRTGGNIVEELEKSLSSIEEISGYLKVARSLPLISLYFLKSLKLIKGEKLFNNKFAFFVLDNENLEELWDWSEKEKEMKINGAVYCNQNRKLCYEKIEKFKEIATLPEKAEFLASEDTNGDKVACNLHQLIPNVSQKKADSVIIKWKRFQHYDQRELLGYAIYYTEAPHRNVSLYHNRNACSGDGWNTDDIPNPEGDKEEEISFSLKGLKPFTQYAYYIKTYMTRSGKKGAQSEILYFVTNPGTPSKPEKLLAYSNSTSEIVITWKPPTEPNGNLTHYKILGFVLNKPALEGNNSCPEHKDEPREKESQPQIVKPIPKMEGETCVCPTQITPRPSGIKDTEDIRVSKIEFEDALQTAYFSKRKKDRIKREMTHTDANYEQQLLRQFSSVNRKLLGEKSEPLETLAFSQTVPLTTTQIVIKNLNYFTDYVVKVTACRELIEEEYDSHLACSGNSTIIVTTRKNENADNITDFILIQNMVNGTLGELRLKWEEPQNPNGGILYYKIQYRLVGSEKALPLYDCISRKSFLEQKKEFVVKNLHPGNYSVRVMATSLAGDGPYSPSKSFYIAQPSQSTTDIWSGVFGAFIVSGIIFAIFLFWKRKTNVVPKLFANVNPEYVSAATVYVPDEWEVPRKNIELIRELGQGSFGMVYEGIARDIVPGQPEVRCAVKTVNEVATDRDRMEFLNEASVMKAFNTHHVVQLLGVVSEGQPTLVVMELMVNGDLKTYLRSHRPEFCEDKRKQPPTLKRILGMAIEIADGMAYLAAKKFVHRDLAARNCMVAEDLTVKIGDFGMTRDIYETDYYKKGTKGLLPVRWMAPESLKDGVFTTYSDVWSYGVVLWEMVTLASQPYQGLSNDQVLRYVIEGGVMERPENCPDKLYELMKLCWQYKPTARPHFMDFVSALLLDASPEFCKYSYYHSAEGRELRAHLETIDTELILPTPETPLKLATDIEDFSVGGSEPELDEDEEEAELDVEPPFVSPQRNILSSGSRTESWMKNRTKAAALASVSSSDSSRASKLSNGGANTPVNGYLVGSSSNGTRTTQC